MTASKETRPPDSNDASTTGARWSSGNSLFISRWRARGGHRRQVEEPGEAVAVFFGGRKALELFDIERKPGVAVHETDDVASLAHHQGDRLILADWNADAAGKSGKGS